MSKASKELGKSVKLCTAKMFELKDGGIYFIALSSTELFGKADMILVSKDQETWIAHSYDDFMNAINNELPLKVA